MKASILNKVGEPLQLQDIAIPQPKPGEVLVKVFAAGVNYADNLKQAGRYYNMPQLPITLGLEVGGIVIETGDKADRELVGKRVLALLGGVGEKGGFAEYAIAKIQEVIPIPANVSYEDSLALSIQGLTAYFLITEQARIGRNDSIFIHAAAGGVGTIAIQLAKILGIRKVVAGASSAGKLQLASSLGADVLINYTEDGWVEKLLQETDNRGVDIVLSSASGDIATDSLNVLAPMGRFLIFGNVLSSTWTSMHIAKMLGKSQSITGFFLGSYTSIPGNYARATSYLLRLIASGELKIISGNKYKLENAQLALDDLAARKTVGKVVLMTDFFSDDANV